MAGEGGRESINLGRRTVVRSGGGGRSAARSSAPFDGAPFVGAPFVGAPPPTSSVPTWSGVLYAHPAGADAAKAATGVSSTRLPTPAR